MVLVIACLMFLALFMESRRPLPPDSIQIRDVLSGVQQAVEKRRLGEAMSFVSRDYTDDTGTNYNGLMKLGREAFRSSGKYDVSMSDQEISVSGDKAEAKLNARVRLIYTVDDYDILFDEQLTLYFSREKVRRWVVLPGYRWRISGVDGLAGYQFD